MQNIKRLFSNDEAVKDVLSEVDLFALDMDGVLWTGGSPIPSAAKTVNALVGLGKKVVYVTNNSTRARSDLADRLVSMGFPCAEDSLYFTANLVPKYLKRIGYSGVIYCMGSEALKSEIKKEFSVLDNSSHNTKVITEWTEYDGEEVDTSIGCVVAGFDPHLNYYKLFYASAILQKNPNALFIATNMDLTCPTKNHKLPGSGSCIAALETAAGRKPTVIGKPNPFFIESIVKDHDVPKERICMIGDNLLTDIEFANKAGIRSILVESGVHKEDDVKDFDATPEFVASSIAVFFK